MASALNEGDVFAGRFRIEGLAGRGGMGAVYRARDIGTSLPVALKILVHQNLHNSSADRRRFERETKLVAQLDHPNVVKMLDAGTNAQGQGYIAFEFLEGRSLSSVLKDRGPFAPHEAWRIGTEVLAGLQAAHKLGIVHRDIKPGNIHLCGEQFTAKILDFGIAKALVSDSNMTQVTEAGEMVGTPQYMAPEQVKGLEVTPATDVYSLGLVLAELRTGTRVIVDKTLVNVYMLQMDAKPLPLAPAAMEGEFGKVIRKATQKVSRDRYASAEAMREALLQAEPALDAAPAVKAAGVPLPEPQPAEAGTVVMTQEQLDAMDETDDDQAPTQLMTQDKLADLVGAQAGSSSMDLMPPASIPSAVDPPGDVTPTSTDALDDLIVLPPDRTWLWVSLAALVVVLVVVGLVLIGVL